MTFLYGSGGIENGFVLAEAPEVGVAENAPYSLWLLRMNNGKAAWVRCGNRAAFNEGFTTSGQDASFARVESLLYFTHSHNAQIGCINTAASAPSITLPENINTFLGKLYSDGPTITEGPLQAQSSSDNGMLIIEYPDAGWNDVYYAVDASGTVIGSLRADKTSITSFDANGKRGFSIKTSGSISFPSIDLFQ